MQIAIYQIGNRGMLKVEGAKIRIKSYKISNDIKGKVLTVERSEEHTSELQSPA